MVHIAVIPARAGSVGLPGKNRMFFDHTADFIDATDWIERTVVTSDDDVVMEKAASRSYETIRRPADLAGSDVSIHATFRHLVDTVEIAADDVLWLFYLPLVYKDPSDFEAARHLIETEGCESLIGLRPAKSHPFSCWKIDDDGQMHQYIENDVYRRQDMPPAWTHHHYVCAFRRRVFDTLNSELIGQSTHPFVLKPETVNNLIEVDTPEDLDAWMRRKSESKQDKN